MVAQSEKKDVESISHDVSNSFEAAMVLHILESRIKQTLLEQSSGPILWSDVSFEDKKQVSAVIFEESTQPVNKVGVFSATESLTGKQKIGKYLSGGDDYTTNLDRPIVDAEAESGREESAHYSNIIRVKRLPTEIEPKLFFQHHMAGGNVYTLSLDLLRQIGKDDLYYDEFSQAELKILTGEVSKMTKYLTNWVDTQEKHPLKDLKEFNWYVPIEYPADEDNEISFSLWELVDILQINVSRIKELNDDLFEKDQMDLMEITAVAEADALLSKFPKKE